MSNRWFRRKAKSDQYQQLPFDFEAVIESSEVLSRDDVSSRLHEQGYDPVEKTTAYMQRAVQIEEAWETTIQQARNELLELDPRALYLEFFLDMQQQIEQNGPRAGALASLVETVGVRGLGMTRSLVAIDKPRAGATRWKIRLDVDAIRDHLAQHILGDKFLTPIKAGKSLGRGPSPLIGASDVSQHRSAVPVPARFFKRNVPFVLNNAAGALFSVEDGQPKYTNVFNPRPSDELLRWMLIDPSYQDELEPEDYERCIASAMDVGQYKFDLDYLIKSDKRPDLIFRDGSLFPQDAYLDNFVLESKRGDFTREAIRELLSCLNYVSEVGTVYCGVSKNVQLKVYSAIVDWYIERYIDTSWTIGNYTLNDGQAMSLLLSAPSFVESDLQQVISTCLIRRSFTTRANLNTRANLTDLDAYFDNYQSQHQDFDIAPYRRLCHLAHVYMFFIGHSKSPQQQLPRYEFFHGPKFESPFEIAQAILTAVRTCGLMNDNDHSFMSDKPITYLIPSVTQQAHLLSKDVGKYIDTATGQRIMARYRSMVPNA